MGKYHMNQFITLLLILILILPPVVPVAFSMEVTWGNPGMEGDALKKITPEIQRELENEEYVEVLVKLNQQVDTEKVSREAVNAVSATTEARQRKEFVRSRVVEALRKNAENQQKGLLKYLEAEKSRGRVQELRSYYIVNMVFVKALPEVIHHISRRPETKVILPNEKIALTLPQGEEFEADSHPTIQWNVERVGAPQVWETFNSTGSGVVVGMIDTGIHWQHEALKEKWRGFNPDDPMNPDPEFNWYDPVYGRDMPADLSITPHGTHVMGTVLGSTPDFFVGTAPGAQWIAANAFREEDGKVIAYSSDLLSAGEYMLAPYDADGIPHPDQAPDIINNSWGGKAKYDEWFRPMVQSWRAAQILPVFAAGNDGPGTGTISNPSNYPENIAVAAVNSSNSIAFFSSRGPGPYPDIIKPDISAPGVNILSSVPGGYESWQGTSMAAPHIAGVAALMLSDNPSLTVSDIEQTLKDTAQPLIDGTYTDSPNHAYGYGLVNAYEAVSASRETTAICGQVLAAGIDDEPPVIVHEPQDIFYLGLDFPVTVQVSDNVSVSRVEVVFKEPGTENWLSIELEKVAGNHRDGTYAGTVPWYFVEKPLFEYIIVSRDFSGNITESPVYQVYVHYGLQAGHVQDFSDYPLGWQMFEDWEWGSPSVGPLPVYGDRLIGTNLSGNYSNNQVSFLLSPPLDVRNMDTPFVQVTHWYDLEYYFDDGVIWATGDYGENWEMIESFTGRDQAWRDLLIPLEDYSGYDQVFLCFALYSDEIINYKGWYIDRFIFDEMRDYVVYYEDFEEGPGGWITYGNENSWQWGTPSSGPMEAYSGTKLWGTNLSGNYFNDSYSFIESPVIDLQGLTSADLEFYHWFDLENNYDFGWVVFFENEYTSEFWYFEDYIFSGSKQYWSQDNIPLDFFLQNGWEEIYVGFLLYSDSSITYEGWYIDDVKIFSQEMGNKTQSITEPETGKLPFDRLGRFSSSMEEEEEESFDREQPPSRKINMKIREDGKSENHTVYNFNEGTPQGLPADASVTVVETEISVNTSTADGTFYMSHPPSSPGELWTLRVEAEGYITEEVTVELEQNEELLLHFLLEPDLDGLLLGDVNGDGNIDVADAIHILRDVVGMVNIVEQYGLEAFFRGDVNGDGSLDVGDAILILRYIVGIINEFPAAS